MNDPEFDIVWNGSKVHPRSGVKGGLLEPCSQEVVPSAWTGLTTVHPFSPEFEYNRIIDKEWEEWQDGS